MCKKSTATAAVFGEDGEAFSHGVFDVVYGMPAGETADRFVHQHVESVDLAALFIFFKLIQSQAQAGPASAKALNDDPQHLAGVFLEHLLQDFLSRIGDVNHLSLLGVGIFAPHD